jgi:chromate transporter
MGLLSHFWGWEHTFTQMGWFFTKAALLTFGGAYAVLPYVMQGAVTQYAWVTPTQMMDGLALGETTPGPLIMIVAFIGFAGGYTKLVFGPDAPILAGAIAACLVTWFTFLPSFIFIFAGGPFIESTHGNFNLTAPLTAITAAVVGVILNLAIFFGRQVLWPQGFGGGVDVAAALIAVGAAIALLTLKRSVIQVVVGCAFAGLAIKVLTG